jgi:hypothetical protein
MTRQTIATRRQTKNVRDFVRALERHFRIVGSIGAAHAA